MGDGDEALFVEDGVLAEDAVDDAAEAAGEVGHGGGASSPGLGEDGHDAVAGLEAGDRGAGGEDFTHKQSLKDSHIMRCVRQLAHEDAASGRQRAIRVNSLSPMR